MKNTLKLMDEPSYKYHEALYKSFYSPSLYVDVGKRWKGLGLLYLLLAVMIASIPFAIKMGLNLNKSFNEHIIEPLSLLPTVYVQNGNVLFDKPMPYLIKNKKGEVALIIDTTGTVTTFSDKYPDLSILINKNTLFFKMPSPQLFNSVIQQPNVNKPMAQSFGKASFVVDGKRIIEEHSLNRLKYVSQLFIYPMVVVILYFMLLIIFLVLAFLGQLLAVLFFTYKISFIQSTRLFLVAATPMLLILVLLLMANATFPGFGFVLLVILSIYYSFAIFALKRQSKRVVTT